MFLVGSFNQSVELEIALSKIEELGVTPEKILIVFMNDHLPSRSKKKSLEEVQSTAFEIGIAIATGLSVIGASIGFKLPIGPIFTGLLFALVGFLLGFITYYFTNRKKSLKHPKGGHDVILIIQCPKEHLNEIKEILWKNHALSIGVRN
ncbi:hypothetical protein [Bacillus sp. B1-b2]|uniref:hypothetical protein n=1 Tax=Bacillus sp. B1-b2 TaxID=2653201 RepID=UPI00126140D8|nr:hypothetical protein [Bacillus sp. B1-b2]KAB7670705.1 hypothetical protein F9279_07760 [Bacillus sp. B1-b2]